MPCCSSLAALLLAVIPCLVFSAEIPNLKPGDVAPPFVLQAKISGQQAEELLKYGTVNDSNIQGPIVFLAYTTRSGFLERLLSNPNCFKELMENSPDNVNYVFLFFADFPTTCNKDTKLADQLQKRFRENLYSYYAKK